MFIKRILFSQNKVSKTVADISVSGTKLHVSYSDGTSKEMNMPPATSLRLPAYNIGGNWWYTGSESANDYFELNEFHIGAKAAYLSGRWYYSSGNKEVTFGGGNW